MSETLMNGNTDSACDMIGNKSNYLFDFLIFNEEQEFPCPSVIIRPSVMLSSKFVQNGFLQTIDDLDVQKAAAAATNNFSIL